MLLPGRIAGKGKKWQCICTELALVTEAETRAKSLRDFEQALHVLFDSDGEEIFTLEDYGENFLIDCSRTDLLLPILLRQLRQSQGLSLADLCRRLGYSSRGTIAQYEQGRSEPSVRKLQDILDAFSLDLCLSFVPKRSKTKT